MHAFGRFSASEVTSGTRPRYPRRHLRFFERSPTHLRGQEDKNLGGDRPDLVLLGTVTGSGREITWQAPFALVVTERGGRQVPLATVGRSTVCQGRDELTAPIVRTLKAWKRILLSNANARDIFGSTSPTPADAFIYTDGSHPDELHDDPPRIGWAAFLSESISGGTDLERWSPRMTQVFMVELAGAVVALYTLAPRLTDRFVTMLIDAEAVEAALIRGCSSQEDTADLVSIFWQITVNYVTNPSDRPSWVS